MHHRVETNSVTVGDNLSRFSSLDHEVDEYQRVKEKAILQALSNGERDSTTPKGQATTLNGNSPDQIGGYMHNQKNDRKAINISRGSTREAATHDNFENMVQAQMFQTESRQSEQ